MVTAGLDLTTGGMTAARRLPSGSCAWRTGLSSSSFLPNWLAITSRAVRSLAASKRTDSSRHSLPSRSDHQDASGLPMISLMLSSSKSGSMGRRKGRINSKLIGGISWDGSPAKAGLPKYKEQGLNGRFFRNDFLLFEL